MWLYIIFCIALFHVVKTQSNSPNNGPEEMFVDVIKNISRVNNVLQELISNYETLQNIYKSQENLDSSQYSDTSVDELFQDIKKQKIIQKSKATKKEKFAATEMYWSDHEETRNNAPDKKKENFVDEDKNGVKLKSRTSKTKRKPEESSSNESSSVTNESEENASKEKIKLPQNPHKKNKWIKTDGLKEINISKNNKKGNNKVLPRAHHSKNLRIRNEKNMSGATPTKKSFYDLLNNKPIRLEAHSEIFIEKVKNPATNKHDILRDKRRDTDKLAKTIGKHHLTQEHRNQVALNETHLKLLRTDNVTKSNITHHAKNYHKKIGDDTKSIYIDYKNESIDLRRDPDNDDKKTQDDDNSGDVSYLKASNDHKKPNRDHKMVNNTQEQRGTVDKSEKKKKLYKETQVASSDESVLMDKNDTHVLREAYGEACMKVVVRKCYKACMRSSKVVCKQTKCKSALKSTFKGQVKTACIDRFTAKDDQQINTKSELMNDEDLFTERRALKENNNNLKAGGFHVCLPTLSVPKVTTTLKTGKNETKSPGRNMTQKTDEKLTFNILRDRFEKACKKVSYGKCRDSCKSSWEKACAKNDCTKRLQSLYKKSCKRSCKSAYGLVKHSKSSSDSSSDDDSSNSS